MKNLSNCPVCHHELLIREYHCPACEISFRGEFAKVLAGGIFCLTAEFIKLFLLVQGNLKELQKQLGISYPTVKNRLAELNRIITKDKAIKLDYTDVLADLEEGFIDVEEAINMIEKRKDK